MTPRTLLGTLLAIIAVVIALNNSLMRTEGVERYERLEHVVIQLFLVAIVALCGNAALPL